MSGWRTEQFATVGGVIVRVHITGETSNDRATTCRATGNCIGQITRRAATTMLRIGQLVEAVVDDTIAIVVEVVAGFTAWAGGAGTGNRTSGTNGSASGAFAGVGAAAQPAPRIAVVRCAVTIVVQPVAALNAAVGFDAAIFTAVERITIEIKKVGIAGTALTVTRCAQCAGIGKHARIATAATVIGIGQFVDAFVDHAVAVVVGIVAPLNPGIDTGVFATVHSLAVHVKKSKATTGHVARASRAARNRIGHVTR